MFGKPAPDLLKYRDKVLRYIEKAQICPIDKKWLIDILAVEFVHVHANNEIFLIDNVQLKALVKIWATNLMPAW